MAITAAIPNSFKSEALQGIHAIADVFRIALFTSAANLSKATTAYSTSGEASGTGYTAGGQALSGAAVTLDGDTAILDFADPSWATSTITARGALIYNASKGNRAVAVLDFGADITSTNGPFSVTLPNPTAAAGLLRIA